MKKGRDYELKTAGLLRLQYPADKVIHDAKVTGILTEEKRQIDVKVDLSEYEYIAYECKDKKAPIDSPVVEGFIQKLEDIGATKGAIVSNSPFTSGAKRLAAKKNIELLHLIDAENPDIRVQVAAPTLARTKEIKNYSIGFNTMSNRPFPPVPIADFPAQIIEVEGTRYTLFDYLRHEWNHGLNVTAAEGANELIITDAKLIDADGTIYIVDKITIMYFVVTENWLGVTHIETARGLYNVRSKVFQGFGSFKTEHMKIEDMSKRFKRISPEEAEHFEGPFILSIGTSYELSK